jgi:DNA-binding response OmpR family regulator
MKILILEDDTTRVNTFIEMLYKHDLVITENAYDAIEYLTTNTFDLIFLDHDLGIDNGSGSIVSSFLRESRDNNNNQAVVIVHSWNVPASKGMMKDLPGAAWAPFGTEGFYELAIKDSK